MIYLIFAVLCSAGVSVVMRFSVGHSENNLTMLTAGYFSCTVIALFHTIRGGSDFNFHEACSPVACGIIAGILLLAGFIFLQINVRLNGVVLSGIFAKLGVLVPTVISVTFFGESPGILQVIGFIMALAAIVLINSDQGKRKVNSGFCLIMLLLSNGSADGMSKIYEELGYESMQDYYLLISFAVALLLSLILVVYKKQGITQADIGFGLLLGVPNYYSMRFLVKALSDVPAILAYPTYSVATIVVITVAGVIFFNEKLSSRQKISFGIIIGALVLLNL